MNAAVPFVCGRSCVVMRAADGTFAENTLPISLIC